METRSKSKVAFDFAGTSAANSTSKSASNEEQQLEEQRLEAQFRQARSEGPNNQRRRRAPSADSKSPTTAPHRIQTPSIVSNDGDSYSESKSKSCAACNSENQDRIVRNSLVEHGILMCSDSAQDPENIPQYNGVTAFGRKYDFEVDFVRNLVEMDIVKTFLGVKSKVLNSSVMFS